MGATVTVPLTKGFVTVVDEADIPIIQGHKWRVSQAGPNKFYAAASGVREGKRCNIYMHRLLMGEPANKLVDHHDNDGLNNRRANLREADKGQNGANSTLSSRNKTGAKGVMWDAQRAKFAATITVGGKHRHLGRFASREAAARAYAKAAVAAHGEFANPVIAGIDANKTICLFRPSKGF